MFAFRSLASASVFSTPRKPPQPAGSAPPVVPEACEGNADVAAASGMFDHLTEAEATCAPVVDDATQALLAQLSTAMTTEVCELTREFAAASERLMTKLGRRTAALDEAGARAGAEASAAQAHLGESLTSQSATQTAELAARRQREMAARAEQQEARKQAILDGAGVASADVRREGKQRADSVRASGTAAVAGVRRDAAAEVARLDGEAAGQKTSAAYLLARRLERETAERVKALEAETAAKAARHVADAEKEAGRLEEKARSEVKRLETELSVQGGLAQAREGLAGMQLVGDRAVLEAKAAGEVGGVATQTQASKDAVVGEALAVLEAEHSRQLAAVLERVEAARADILCARDVTQAERQRRVKRAVRGIDAQSGKAGGALSRAVGKADREAAADVREARRDIAARGDGAEAAIHALEDDLTASDLALVDPAASDEAFLDGLKADARKAVAGLAAPETIVAGEAAVAIDPRKIDGALAALALAQEKDTSSPFEDGQDEAHGAVARLSPEELALLGECLKDPARAELAAQWGGLVSKTEAAAREADRTLAAVPDEVWARMGMPVGQLEGLDDKAQRDKLTAEIRNGHLDREAALDLLRRQGASAEILEAVGQQATREEIVAGNAMMLVPYAALESVVPGGLRKALRGMPEDQLDEIVAQVPEAQRAEIATAVAELRAHRAEMSRKAAAGVGLVQNVMAIADPEDRAIAMEKALDQVPPDARDELFGKLDPETRKAVQAASGQRHQRMRANAKALFGASAGQGGTDEKTIRNLMASLRPEDLAELREIYAEQNMGHSLDVDLINDLDAEDERADLNVVLAKLSGREAEARARLLNIAASVNDEDLIFATMEASKTLEEQQQVEAAQEVLRARGLSGFTYDDLLDEALEGDELDRAQALREGNLAKYWAVTIDDSLEGSNDMETVNRASQACPKKLQPEMMRYYEERRLAQDGDVVHYRDEVKDDAGVEGDLALGYLDRNEVEIAKANLRLDTTEQSGTNELGAVKVLIGPSGKQVLAELSDDEKARMLDEADTPAEEALLEAALKGELDPKAAVEVALQGEACDLEMMKVALHDPATGKLWPKAKMDEIIKSVGEEKFKFLMQQNAGGRDTFEVELMLDGEPDTLEKRLARVAKIQDFERGEGGGGLGMWLTDTVGDAGVVQDAQCARVLALGEKIKSGTATPDEIAEFERRYEYYDDNVENQRSAKDTIGNLVTEIVAGIAGFLATIATGGAAGPIVGALIGGLARGGLGAAIQGDAFNAHDAGKVVIGTAVDMLTAAIPFDKLLKIGGLTKIVEAGGLKGAAAAGAQKAVEEAVSAVLEGLLKLSLDEELRKGNKSMGEALGEVGLDTLAAAGGGMVSGTLAYGLEKVGINAVNDEGKVFTATTNRVNKVLTGTVGDVTKALLDKDGKLLDGDVMAQVNALLGPLKKLLIAARSEKDHAKKTAKEAEIAAEAKAKIEAVKAQFPGLEGLKPDETATDWMDDESEAPAVPAVDHEAVTKQIPAFNPDEPTVDHEAVTKQIPAFNPEEADPAATQVMQSIDPAASVDETSVDPATTSHEPPTPTPSHGATFEDSLKELNLDPAAKVDAARSYQEALLTGTDDEAQAAYKALTGKTKAQLDDGALALARQTAALLTPEELAAIHIYTDRHYKTINPAMRGASPEAGEPGAGDTDFLPQIQGLVDTIHQALAKLPVQTGIVHRGNALSPESLERYVRAFEEGSTVSDLALQSASWDVGIADEFRTKQAGRYADKIPVQFEIESVTGRRVDYLSQHGREAEVLFSGGTSFEVISIEEAMDDCGNPYKLIRMMETADGGGL